MADAIYVLMRWLHISSAVTLVGGMIFGRWVMTRAADALAPDARETFLDRAAAIYQPLVFAAANGMPMHENNADYQWVKLPETVKVNGRPLDIYKSRTLPEGHNGYFA